MKYLKPAAVALAVCLFAPRVEAVPGDINKDGIVNLVDFFILADNFGQEGQSVENVYVIGEFVNRGNMDLRLVSRIRG